MTASLSSAVARSLRDRHPGLSGPGTPASIPARYTNMPMFYIWYTRDPINHKLGWNGGVLETPLIGYYDSRDYDTEYRELKTLAEWGINAACLSWWGPQQDGIVDTICRAADNLRAEGYNIWLTAYIEHGFDYANLLANAAPGTMFSHPFERYYARYPHLWATVDGKPYVVIYGRCGVPQLPTDNDGFHDYLRAKYGDIAALNAKWGADFASFDAIEHLPDDTPGWQRAESALYSTRLMERQWRQVERALRERAGIPGVAICADINSFAPSAAGYSAVTRVLGGVHTYNDMGQPEEREIHRFAYARAAQHFGGLFFDHIKARYDDSVHRVLGFIYPPDPFKFERWWIEALLHHTDKVQHPSWNEFWEGSNIEPSFECGKRWVEKNELYSSVLAECMPATRERDLNARLCVIFNEWAPFYFGRPADDLLGIVQALRRLDAAFDLLPEHLVTAAQLKRCRVILAPTCGVGFGFNRDERPVMDVLREWISAGRNRKLLLTRAPEWGDLLGFTLTEQAEAAADRAIIDIGTTADEAYIGGGWRGREDWGKLSPGAPGYGTNRTIRWTTAQRSTMLVPTVPGNDHTLRIIAEWHYPCRGAVLVNGHQVGRFDEQPARTSRQAAHRLRFDIPAAVVNGRDESKLEFVHDALWVPAEVGQGGDTSTLGIAVDVVDVAVKGHEHDKPALRATDEITLNSDIFGDMAGARIEVSSPAGRDRIAPRGAEVLATYSDGSPKYLRARVGGNEVIYDNGISGALMTPDLMRNLLRHWARVGTPQVTLPEGMVLTRLPCDDTTLVAVSNATGEPAEFQLRLPVGRPTAGPRDKPAVRITRLDVDGQLGAPMETSVRCGAPALRDKVTYYGLYQVTQAPLLADLPELRLAPNGEYDVWVSIESAVDRELAGEAWIEGAPSLKCERTKFTLAPRQRSRVKLVLRAGDFWDWGRRTVRLKVDYGDGRATFWQFAEALRPAELKLTTTCFQVPTQGAQVAVELKNTGEAPARDVIVSIGDKTAAAGDIAPGATGQAHIEVAPSQQAQRVRISYHRGQSPLRDCPTSCAALTGDCPHFVALDESIVVGGLPTKDQGPAVVITNPSQRERRAVWAELPAPLPEGSAVFDGDKPLPLTGVGGPAALVDLAPAQTKTLRVAMEPRHSCGYAPPGPPPRPQGLRGLGATGRSARAPDLPTDVRIARDDAARTVTIENSHLRLVFDENAGATLRSLATLAKGIDYGAGSFGCEYRLGARTAAQRSSPGRLQVIEHDRFGAAVEATWEDARIAVAQVWRLRAHQPFVDLSVTITPKALPDDALVTFLNSHLARNDLRRIFPGFTTLGENSGWTPEMQAEHFGWKEYRGAWVPPAWAAYMVDANDVRDALAIIPTTPQALAGFRQGFYPERKFEAPGVARYCDIEVYAQPGGGPPAPRGPMTAQFAIYNFSGYWDKFEEFIADRAREPVAVVVR